MYTTLLLAAILSLAVVQSHGIVRDLSACIEPPNGNVTFTIRGLQGLEGNPGLVGPKGSEGPVGKQGEKGKRGVTGPVGPRGDPGLPGAIGPRGHRGVDGSRGHLGREGPHGPPGPPGPPGVRGPPGSQGATGTCNFSDATYQQLTQDIRTNLTEEVIQALESKYPLLASLGIECIPYLVGSNGQSQNNSATSCKHIYQCSLSTAPSGYYWITTSNGTAIRMYCEMNLTHCGNTTGGWTRVAYINVIYSGCPGGLNYMYSPKRMCARRASGCSSVRLPEYAGSYTKVCGRALGYQCEETLAFNNYHHGGWSTRALNSHYVDGLSVTYGNPRHHVWTFASGSSKDQPSYQGRCPCAPPPFRSHTSAPPFVGSDYFCESGNSGYYDRSWYLSDPLWDGNGCARGSGCCNGPNRPWFYRELNGTVTDNIEVRMCVNSRANIGVEELEIYVS